MRDNTHQVTNSPSTLEAQEGMKTMKPPAFGLTDASDAEGNAHFDLHYGSEISYEDGEPAGCKGKTVAEVVVENLGVTREGDAFQVAADLICWPLITLWSGDNALGKLKNIEDENSPHITAANYRQVATELFPDANGYTHSARYWSKPITRHHEEVHAREMIEVGKTLLQSTVIDPLSQRHFDDESDIELEVFEAANDLENMIQSSMEAEGEAHAYKGTMHEFVALSQAIIAKGDAGGYK